MSMKAWNRPCSEGGTGQFMSYRRSERGSKRSSVLVRRVVRPRNCNSSLEAHAGDRLAVIRTRGIARRRIFCVGDESGATLWRPGGRARSNGLRSVRGLGTLDGAPGAEEAVQCGLVADPLSANVRETRSTQRIRGAKAEKTNMLGLRESRKRMVVPLEPGMPSEARKLLRPEVVDRPLRRRFESVVQAADRRRRSPARCVHSCGERACTRRT